MIRLKKIIKKMYSHFSGEGGGGYCMLFLLFYICIYIYFIYIYIYVFVYFLIIINYSFFFKFGRLHYSVVHAEHKKSLQLFTNRWILFSSSVSSQCVRAPNCF